MDAVESKAESRRRYKAAWMRKKRAVERLANARSVRLWLPLRMADRLDILRGAQPLPKFITAILRQVVEHSQVDSAPSQPRNALCQCGSGKKFKRCCGAPK